jgi:hypothetical protein
MPERSDIAAYLIEQAPQIVTQRNALQYRPIDLVSHRIMMMEEQMKYADEGLKDRCRSDLEKFWETVHFLAHASSGVDFHCRQQPLVHSCLQSTGFPRSLIQRAVERYRDQLNVANAKGNLPLHLIAMNPPVTDDDDFDEADEFFLTILRRNIGAATILNNDGLSPLALAIQSGRKWGSGMIRSSLSLTPSSIGTLDLPAKILPFLLARLIQENKMGEAYGILRVAPPTSDRF